jgi:hypothetical protein
VIDKLKEIAREMATQAFVHEALPRRLWSSRASFTSLDVARETKVHLSNDR